MSNAPAYHGRTHIRGGTDQIPGLWEALDGILPGGDQSYIEAALALSPRAYWPLQEASSLPRDVSGNGYHITSLVGSPTYQVDGPHEGTYGIQFTNDNFTRATIGGSTTTPSIVFWIYVSSVHTASNHYVFANGAGSSGVGLDGITVYLISGRKFKVTVEGVANLADSTAALPLDEWAHVAIVRDAGTWKYYINGAVDTANAGSAVLNAPTVETTFGAYGSSSDNRLAHVTWYDTALTAGQIATLYGSSGLAEKGELLATNLTGTFERLAPAASNGLALLSDDTEDLGVEWGILGLAGGGLGVALTDPNADRILFWDDSAGAYAFLTAGTGLTITGTTITAAGGSGGSTEHAYVERTSNLTVTATSAGAAQEVVSAGAVSFDGSTRVCIEFYSPGVGVGSTAGSAILLNLWDGSTDLGRIGTFQNASLFASCLVRRIITPSNASHTYKIMAWRATSDGTVEAGSGGTDPARLPAYIRITTA